jgi:hypothetical protein
MVIHEQNWGCAGVETARRFGTSLTDMPEMHTHMGLSILRETVRLPPRVPELSDLKL